MAKEKNNGKFGNDEKRLPAGRQGKDKKIPDGLLTNWTKRWIKAILMFLAAIVVTLGFFDKAGDAGKYFILGAQFLTGRAALSLPLFFILSGIIFIKTRKKGKTLAMFLAIFVTIVGIAGIIGAQDLLEKQGGWIGYLLAKLLVTFFGLLVANIVFGAFILIGLFIFFQFIRTDAPKEKIEKEKKPSFAVNQPEDLKIRGITSEKPEPAAVKKAVPSKVSLFKKGGMDDQVEKKEIRRADAQKSTYALPPLELLNKNETSPTPGNIKENSMIIKNTLENFGIPVEMAEVNIGPTVTQYAFKPAEGVKLSKITTLSNNLALALAAHPIRIEAPIPGKSLVGIEVPNKVRSTVTLRNLVSAPGYQDEKSPLTVALGRNVSGAPIFTDITDGPHLLVAGATGTGKTIFLNNLILSLIYKNTPDSMRLIMVDPKRVEFQHYNEIPHLLCPVIFDAQKTINALQWLTREMERRFEVFSEVPARNIHSYNQNKGIIASGAQLPYIVFVVDELADLMAAKGREIEAGVVRLAQMARATGIHLVLATQRPSVEVITGLIKANVPTRITFQVSSQIDSRTVIDTSGAEKLLGAGDMLFLSSKSAKISRIQGPYISEKEVKDVADFWAEQGKKVEEHQTALTHSLAESLERPDPEVKGGEGGEAFFGDDDPLFEDVKRIVLETQKASASFLQRRLRIGYSRAARLIDILEEKGIVGPADGAKPREVYASKADIQLAPENAHSTGMKASGMDESEEPQESADPSTWTKV